MTATTMKSEDDTKEFLLHCKCKGYHFFHFWYDKDWGLNFAFIEQPKSFRERLKAAFQCLRGKTVYEGDLIVDEVDYHRIDKFFKEVKKAQK